MRGASEPGEETEFKPGKRGSNRGKRVQVGRGEIRGRENEFEGGGARLPGEKLISRGKKNSSRGKKSSSRGETSSSRAGRDFEGVKQSSRGEWRECQGKKIHLQ